MSRLGRLAMQAARASQENIFSGVVSRAARTVRDVRSPSLKHVSTTEGLHTSAVAYYDNKNSPDLDPKDIEKEIKRLKRRLHDLNEALLAKDDFTSPSIGRLIEEVQQLSVKLDDLLLNSRLNSEPKVKSPKNHSLKDAENYLGNKLAQAIEKNDVKTLKVLLESPEFPNFANRPIHGKKSPLYYAASLGRKEMVEILMENRYVILDAPSKKGRTAADISRRKEHDAFHKLSAAPDLSLMGLESDNYSNHKGIGETLSGSVGPNSEEDPSQAKEGEKVFGGRIGRSLKEKPLVTLSEENKAKLTELLEKAKGKFDDVTKRAHQPELEEIPFDDILRDMANKLPKLGVAAEQPTVLIDRSNVLHIIAKSSLGNHAFETLLREDPQLVKELINQQDKDGNTPLHIAALKGNVDTAIMLLTNGAIHDIRNSEGKTPEEVALERIADYGVKVSEGQISNITQKEKGDIEYIAQLLQSITDLKSPSANPRSPEAGDLGNDKERGGR